MIRTNLRANFRRSAGRERGQPEAVPAWILLREQLSVLVFGALFLLGVGLGATVISWLDADTAKSLSLILGGFVEGRGSQPLATTFLSALTPNIGMLTLLLLCGFCAISAPLVALVPWFKGLGFGLTASAMLSGYGMDALGYLGVLVLPNLIWSTVILLLGCRDALRMSLSFWNAMKPAVQRGAVIHPGTFCARCILYAVLLAVGAMAEAYSFLLLAGTFALG